MHRTDVSAKLFADACAVIPGGVNSPVRAFTSVGGTPRFITSATGYWLTDADGNRYVDLVCSWGPMILGHAHPAVVEAVQRAAADGLSFGAPTPSETELAAEIIGRVAAGGAAAAGQLRHRGHHERDPAGPRLHRPRQDHQVLRLLPRPQRRAAGRRRLGCRHAGAAVLAGGHRRGRRRHDRVAVQQRSRGRRGVRDGSATRSPASSPRPAPATWAPSRRCPATTPRCAASPPTTARC